jgi:hypothetical protein
VSVLERDFLKLIPRIPYGLTRSEGDLPEGLVDGHECKFWRIDHCSLRRPRLLKGVNLSLSLSLRVCEKPAPLSPDLPSPRRVL